MSFWNIFGKMAVSDDGTTIQKLSDTSSVKDKAVGRSIGLVSLIRRRN